MGIRENIGPKSSGRLESSSALRRRSVRAGASSLATGANHRVPTEGRPWGSGDWSRCKAGIVDAVEFHSPRSGRAHMRRAEPSARHSRPGTYPRRRGSGTDPPGSSGRSDWTGSRSGMPRSPSGRPGRDAPPRRGRPPSGSQGWPASVVQMTRSRPRSEVSVVMSPTVERPGRSSPFWQGCRRPA